MRPALARRGRPRARPLRAPMQPGEILLLLTPRASKALIEGRQSATSVRANSCVRLHVDRSWAGSYDKLLARARLAPRSGGIRRGEATVTLREPSFAARHARPLRFGRTSRPGCSRGCRAPRAPRCSRAHAQHTPRPGSLPGLRLRGAEPSAEPSIPPGSRQRFRSSSRRPLPRDSTCGRLARSPVGGAYRGG